MAESTPHRHQQIHRKRHAFVEYVKETPFQFTLKQGIPCPLKLVDINVYCERPADAWQVVELPSLCCRKGDDYALHPATCFKIPEGSAGYFEINVRGTFSAQEKTCFAMNLKKINLNNSTLANYEQLETSFSFDGRLKKHFKTYQTSGFAFLTSSDLFAITLESDDHQHTQVCCKYLTMTLKRCHCVTKSVGTPRKKSINLGHYLQNRVNGTWGS